MLISFVKNTEGTVIWNNFIFEVRINNIQIIHKSFFPQNVIRHGKILISFDKNTEGFEY